MNPPAKIVSREEFKAIAKGMVEGLETQDGKTQDAREEGGIMRLAARELFPHPLLDRVGMLPEMIRRETRMGNRSGDNRDDHKARAAELSGEFAALVADIAARGIQEPLKVSRGLINWLIADGRNRWEAYQAACEADPETAARLEAQGIPCIEIEDADAPLVILSAMTRRHMSKQARALMAVKVFPEVAESGDDRRRANLSKGNDYPSKGNEYPFKDQADFAARIGVSVETMKDACLFWRKLKLLPKAEEAEDMVQQVMAGISFRDAELGQKGRAATAGLPRQPDKVWTLMARNCGSIKNQWKAFGSLREESRLDIIEKLQDAFAGAPEEVKTALLKTLEGGEA
jgi:hypothetical protein